MARDMATARSWLPGQGLDVVIADTTRPETLPAAVEGIETIIHCAFITAERKQGPGVNYYETNITGTRNLLVAAKQAGVKRVIELGGLGTQPSKLGSYMETRYLADKAIKESGLAWSILGPSVQFGQGAAFFKGLADLIKSVPVITPVVGSGHVQFQPIWVEDVVTCLVKMAQEPARYDGRYIEVGGPELYSYNEILDILMEALGKRRIKVPGPRPIAALAASAMAAALPNPPITPAAIELFDFDNATALDSVVYNFGFQPMSFRAWLAKNRIS
jgi:uncharacterized protein YbjT (DUF2867 family)